jgi:hypothetical protein
MPGAQCTRSLARAGGSKCTGIIRHSPRNGGAKPDQQVAFSDGGQFAQICNQSRSHIRISGDNR